MGDREERNENQENREERQRERQIILWIRVKNIPLNILGEQH